MSSFRHIKAILISCIVYLLIYCKTISGQEYSCPDGCMTCDSPTSSSTQPCYSCFIGYYLSLQTCKSFQCDAHLLFQPSLNACVSVCAAGTYSNWTTHLCEQTDNCSSQYIQPTLTSKSRAIKSVLNVYPHIYIVFDTFIKQTSYPSGALEGIYEFSYTGPVSYSQPAGTLIQISQIQDSFILLYNNSVALWNYTINTQVQLGYISNGSIKSTSQILFVQNEETQTFLVSSLDDSTTIMYLTYMSIPNSDGNNYYNNSTSSQYQSDLFTGKKDPLFQIEASNNNQTVQFFDSFIAIQYSLDQSLTIQRAIRFNGQVQLFVLTDKLICSSTSGMKVTSLLANLLEVTVQGISTNRTFLLAQFANTPGVFLIKTSTSSDSSQSCLRLETISGVALQISMYSNLFLGSFSDKIIRAYQARATIEANPTVTLDQMFSVDVQDMIKHFLMIKTSTDSSNSSSYLVCVLTTTNIVKIFQVTPITGSTSVQYTVSLQQSINPVISSPQKLLVSPVQQSQSQSLAPLLFLVGSDMEIIELTSLKITGKVGDFDDVIYGSQTKINKLLYTEVLKFICSCSDDGRVVMWEAFDMLNPIYSYEILRINQKCIDIVLFQDTILVAMFTSEVVVFEILNSMNISVYPLNTISPTTILTNKQGIFILSDQAMILSSRDKLSFQGSFNLTSLPIQFFVTSQSDILILDSMNNLNLFKFNFSTNQLSLNTQAVTYSASSSLSAIKLVEYSPSSSSSSSTFSIYLSTTDKFFIVLDSNLQEIDRVYKNGSLINRIYNFKNEMIFFLSKYDDGNLGHQYFTESYDVKNKKFTLIGTTYFVQEIASVWKCIENNQDIYNIIEVSPISYTTYSVEIQWKNKSDTKFGKFLFTPGQQQQVVLSDREQKTVVVGSLAGQLRTAPIRRLESAPLRLAFKDKVNQASTDNPIIHLKFSFQLGVLFVVQARSILCYDLHMHTLLTTQDINGSAVSIIDSYLSEYLKLFIVWSQNYLCIYDIAAQQYNPLSNTRNLLINGIYVDPMSNQIFIYGTDISLVDPSNLNSLQTLISPPLGLIYLTCFFHPWNVICKLSNSVVIFYARSGTSLSKIQIVQLTVVTSVSYVLATDSIYQQVFIYGASSIDVYTFQGIYITTIATITSKIIQLIKTPNYFIAITSATGYVVTRGTWTFKIAGSFIPAGGSITKAYYIAMYNQIAYSTDEIRYGQILFFDLNTMLTAGSVSNTYSDNGIGSSIKVSFDDDSKMLNYIDSYGNFQNVIFSSSKTTDNTIGIAEMQAQTTQPPTDYVINWITNTVYIMNANAIWVLNYNLMTRPYQRLLLRKNTFHIMIDHDNSSSSSSSSNQQTQSTTSQQQLPGMLLIDKNNHIYRYQDQKTYFEKDYSSTILDVSCIVSTNIANGTTQTISSIFLFFPTFSYVYSSSSPVNFLDPGYFQKSTDYQIFPLNFRSILCTQEGTIIVDTVENTVVMIIAQIGNSSNNGSNININNNSVILSRINLYQCDSNDRIISQYNNKNILFLGMLSGKLISINLTNNAVYSSDIFINQQGKQQQPSIAKIHDYDSVKCQLTLSLSNGSCFKVDTSDSSNILILLDQPIAANSKQLLDSLDNSSLLIPSSYSTISTNDLLTTNNQAQTELFLLKDCDLYILTIQDSKRARIYNLTDNSFIMNTSFPDDQWKTAKCSQSILIINSASQLNVYAIERSLRTSSSIIFLDKIRRYNRKDRITDIRIIDNSKMIIVFTSRIECIAMDIKQKIIKLVDSVALTDPRLTYWSLNNSLKALVLIGIQSTGVFEKQINFSVFQQSVVTGSASGSQIVPGSQQTVQLCESSLIYNSYDSISGKSQLDRLTSTSTNTNILLSVKIQNAIAPMPFLSSSTQSSQITIILRPQIETGNILNINGNELQDLRLSQLTLEGFEFKWMINSLLQQQQQQRFPLKQLSFSDSSVNVTLRNIIFSNGLVGGVNISGKNVVLIDGMHISNVTLDNLSNSGNLFMISQVDYLFISEVVLSNITVTDSIFNIKNVNKLVISNLRIANSMIKGFSIITLLQANNLRLENIHIVNCTAKVDFNARQLMFTKIFPLRNISRYLADTASSGSQPITTLNPSSIDRYLLQLTGVSVTSLENITMENCVQLKLLSTVKSFLQPNGILMLTSDQLRMNNIQLINNSFPDGQIQQYQQHLVFSHSSIVVISNMQINKNQGNLYFRDSTIFSMYNSTFESNQGISGAALQFYLNQNIQIFNDSSFKYNQAVSSGGAIFFDSNEIIFISKGVMFQNNSAAIGGAIRILSDHEQTKTEQAQAEIINGDFLNNHAKIYGKNIGRFPQKIEIFLANNNITNQMGQSNELQIPLFTADISSFEIKSLSLNNLQSGGFIYLNFRLFDNEGTVFTIDQDSIQNSEYGQDIMNELNKYQIEVSHIQSSPFSEIKGESLITVKQFNSDSNTFSFKSLEISAFPKTSVNSIVIKVTLNSIYAPMIVNTFLGFRECQIGEVPQKETSSIATCQSCPDGSYSLIQPNQTLTTQSSSSSTLQSSSITNINPDYFSFECKKCPISAQSCSKSSIILEKGFWRQNNLSDDILSCNKMNSEICDESAAASKQGCIEGHLGPLCESCDSTGIIWHGDRYTQSFKETECLKCSNYTYQGSFIILSAIILQIYLLFSVLMFMNSYIYNSLSYYLRRLTILPLSKSSIRDESTFFIKALMNYFQLSSILFKSDLSIFPSILTLFPSFAGQPVSKIVVGAQCILPLQLLEEYGQHKLLALAQVTFPFLFLLLTFLILLIFQKFKISKVGSFHKFTMINVLFLFFQPDCIRYFTSAISCRYIGQHSYLATNLLLYCDDEDYRTFKYSVVVTALLFWVLFPLAILHQLLKTLRMFKKAQLKMKKITTGKQPINNNNNINQTYLSSLESSNKDTLRSPYISPQVTDRNPQQCNVTQNGLPSSSDRNQPKTDENTNIISNSISINSPNINTNKCNQPQMPDEIVASKSNPNEQHQNFYLDDQSLSSSSKVLYNPLEFATTKYKFGYFYLEFKRELFYWEFVRIYLKISIVVLVTQLAQLALLVYVFSIVLMFLYIFCVQHLKPFESTILLKLEVLSYFVLITNILLSQIDSQYPAYPLKLATTLIHYGFIFFILLIIIKLKLDSQTNGMSSILRIIVKKLLPASLYLKITQRRLNSMRTLLRWRLIYKNLSVLREIKLNQQMKHIESTTRSKFINSPKLRKQQQTQQYSPLLQTLDLNSKLSQQLSPPQSANQSDMNAIEFKSLQYSQYYHQASKNTHTNENIHTLDQVDAFKRMEHQQNYMNSPVGCPIILEGENNSGSKRTIIDDNSTSIFIKNMNISGIINDSSNRVLCQADKSATVNPSSFGLWKKKNNSESLYEISPERQKDNEFFNNNFDISFTNQITAKQSLSESSENMDATDDKSKRDINAVYDTKSVKTITTAAMKKGQNQEIK